MSKSVWYANEGNKTVINMCNPLSFFIWMIIILDSNRLGNVYNIWFIQHNSNIKEGKNCEEISLRIPRHPHIGERSRSY